MRLRTPAAVVALTAAFATFNADRVLAQPRPPGPPMGGFRPGPVMGPMGAPRSVGLGMPGGIGGYGGMGAPRRPPTNFGGQIDRVPTSRLPSNMREAPTRADALGRNAMGTSRVSPVGAANRPSIGPAGPARSGVSPSGPARAGDLVGSRSLPGAGGLRELARASAKPTRSPTKPISERDLASQGDHVRHNFDHHDCFNKDWWDGHRGCWRAAAWAAAAYSAYSYPSWGDYSGYSGYGGDPIYYDYGSNVVYEGNTVYVNGESTGTPQEYAQQASTIAESGKQADADPDEEWLSLGVFAMTQGEQENGNEVFQLAVNKAGVLRGNYYNLLTDVTHPIYGSVDPQTQRAAWTIGGRKDPTFETGVANLTRPQTPMFVHFGKSSTQQWNLVRIDPPGQTESVAARASP